MTRWKVVTLPSGYIPSIVTDDEFELHITQVAGHSRTDTQDVENAKYIVRDHNRAEAFEQVINAARSLLMASRAAAILGATEIAEQEEALEAAIKITEAL